MNEINSQIRLEENQRQSIDLSQSIVEINVAATTYNHKTNASNNGVEVARKIQQSESHGFKSSIHLGQQEQATINSQETTELNEEDDEIEEYADKDAKKKNKNAAK